MTAIRDIFNWLVYTDAGLLSRLGIAVVIFTAMAVDDLRRKGYRATRWREYLFLVTVVVMSLLYGVIDDLITSRISAEYFLYGKGLANKLGSDIPPDSARLTWEAVKIGVKATWSVGLIVGVSLLIANNPSDKSPQLRYRPLLVRAVMVLLCSGACAVLLGFAGYFGWLIRLSTDFAEMTRNREFRPYRFMAVFGIHLGGYAGGALGTLLAIINVRRTRNSDRPT